MDERTKELGVPSGLVFDVLTKAVNELFTNRPIFYMSTFSRMESDYYMRTPAPYHPLCNPNPLRLWLSAYIGNIGLITTAHSFQAISAIGYVVNHE